MGFRKLFNVIGRMAPKNKRQQRQKPLLTDRTVADVMTRDPVTVPPDMTLSHIINQVVLRHRVNFLPVVETGILLGYIDSDVIASIDREHWSNMRADDIFVELSADRLLSATTTISTVLELIARTGQRKFLVTEGRHLVGVLTLADLTHELLLARRVDHCGTTQ